MVYGSRPSGLLLKSLLSSQYWYHLDSTSLGSYLLASSRLYIFIINWLQRYKKNAKYELVIQKKIVPLPMTMERKHTREEKMEAFGRLLDVMDRLREECPWDRKQTNDSLRPNTIEETYELCDALIRDDQQEICKELGDVGDVLLHVVFYGRIGEEKQQFDIADVCNKLCDKLIFRHPHVYGEAVAKDAEAVLESWEQIKLKEKDGNKTVLSGVPAALPSLIKAYRVQDKARNVGFDWEDKQDVWGKVREELGELEAELRKEDKENSTRELGDFLFSVINAARLYKLNPDNALEMTNQKFIRRFNYIEQHSIRAGKPLTEMTLAEMDALWNEAKEKEKEEI